ncbi:MAG: response regulator [Candidatus Altiarchaeota archaeon]|nr:response regulator [Candidatus Altiarchaeota archaeon]
MNETKKVLVVDDEVSLAKTVKFILDAEGFETQTVFSGEDCLKRIEEEKFDLILLDIMMPKMTGWQVFEEIQKKHPEIKVAFLTVIKYSNAVRGKLEKEGLAACISKPFENDDLVNRVKNITSTQ